MDSLYVNRPGVKGSVDRRRQRKISQPPESTHLTMSTTRPVEIRLGAVKRLTKELLTRRIDVGTEKARLDRFIAEGKDRWDVGKQVRVASSQS